MMCDNQGVVNNMVLPQYTLGKKHNAVNYHVVCEAASAGILWVGEGYMKTNLADLLKNILDWKQYHKLIPFVLYLV